MHENTRTTLRYAQILTAIAIGCCGSNVLQAQDDDGILVPGDSNDYVILADLVSGQVPAVTVGDKVFSIFTYSRAGDMPGASDINVFGFQDPNDHFGLTLQGSFLDAPGDPNGSWASLQFDVDVSDEGQQQGRTISDAHLFMEGLGGPDNSRIGVEESFLNTSEILRVFQSTIPNEAGSQLSDWIDFAETSTNRSVTLLISALAAEDSDQFARTSAIDLSFSQIAVPEPSAALLLMCGVMTAGAGRRRRGA
jgi:hypothetical protein